jgi:Pin2-interacting protein X1
MTIVATEDTRNQEWRKSNVGSKMLEKMGWTEGKGIGKRNVNKTSLRAVKRQDGLGIGAKRQSEGGPSESTGTFAAVLANLKAHHGNSNSNGDSTDKKSTKASKKEAKKAAKFAAKKAARKKHKLSLPQNKVVAGYARKMRAAKFGVKSAQDLACIFGNTEVVSTALGGAAAAPAVSFENAAVANKRIRPSEATKTKDDEKESSEAEAEEKAKDKKPKKEKKSKKDKKKKKSKSE